MDLGKRVECWICKSTVSSDEVISLEKALQDDDSFEILNALILPLVSRKHVFDFCYIYE